MPILLLLIVSCGIGAIDRLFFFMSDFIIRKVLWLSAFLKPLLGYGLGPLSISICLRNLNVDEFRYCNWLSMIKYKKKYNYRIL